MCTVSLYIRTLTLTHSHSHSHSPEPTVVYLYLENTGSIPAEWSFKFLSELEVQLAHSHHSVTATHQP